MKTNTKAKPVPVHTHGGARAIKISTELELRRSVMSTFLWEDQFYESGEEVAKRIYRLAQALPAEVVANIAIEARTKANLRHAPLWILVAMIENKYESAEDRLIVGRTIPQVVKRADEMGELINLYWKDGKKPLTKQMKIGLANAFKSFNEYNLAKYDSDARSLKIRDVMFLVHPKPDNEEQVALFKKVANKELKTPDTWETQLSGGADKKETFTRLIQEGKLGYMALLRNLRNMKEAGVDRGIVRDALMAGHGANKVLPFRFITAASAVPGWEDLIDDAFKHVMSNRPKLKGKTIMVVDVSGSMYHGNISAKSSTDHARAACTLAAMAREMFDDIVIYATAGNDHTRIHQTELVPPRRGIPLIQAIYDMCRPLGGGGIFMTPVMRFLEDQEKTAERIIVITDEQDTSVADKDKPTLAKPFGKFNYLMNVASYQHGIGYGAQWTHIDSFSGSAIEYMQATEEFIQQVPTQ